MNELEYSYAILKYRHDVAAGEVLNIGLVLFAPSLGQVGIVFDTRYARLSQAFANFDGEMYRSVTGRFTTALKSLAQPMSNNLFEIEERRRFDDVSGLIRLAWPDQGLSYFAGPVSMGVALDLDVELKDLFDRFVLSQFDQRDAVSRFDDEQLWESFKRVLSPRGILQALGPVTLGLAEVEFEHAYKNEKWHVFEPLSLDYVDGAAMKRRAFEVAGKAASVRQDEEFGTFTVLLGSPRRVEAKKQFLNAQRILLDAPGGVKIVTESEAEAFGVNLEREMREHNVLKSK